MQIVSSYIWARNNIWQLEYHMVFKNEPTTVVKKIISTRVKCDESTLKYMQTKYMPAKIAELEKEYKDGARQIQLQKRYDLGYFYEKYLAQQQHFITFDKTKARSKDVITYFKANKDIRTITKADIKEYVRFIEFKDGKHLAKDTVKSYFYMLSGMLQIAEDTHDEFRNLCNGMKLKLTAQKNDDSIKPFTQIEVKSLLATAHGDLQNYLGIAFNTGASPEEIIALMPSDIDYENNILHIRRVISKGHIRNKGKTEYRLRQIPLFKSALQYIESQMEISRAKKSMFLFSKEDGSRLNDASEIRGNIKNDTKWYKLLKDCSIEYRPMKNCRHTWAVQAIKKRKLTLQQIADLLGHSDLRMLISHYAKYIKGEALGTSASIDMYTDDEAETNVGKVFPTLLSSSGYKEAYF
jgi:integrase